MPHKKYDLAVKTGSYERNGETKNRYENIGAVWQGENGPYITLKRSFNPAGVLFKEGSDSIIVSCFEPRDEQGGGRQPAPQRTQAAPSRTQAPVDDSDIPF